MAQIVTFVTGQIGAERVAGLETDFRKLIQGGGGPPGMPGPEKTFLLRTGEDRVAILSLWASRADVDALLASGEEPPARRLIRAHGGTPEVTLWEVVVEGSPATDRSGS